MGAYTIKSVGEPKPWSNDFGSFLSYPVDLQGDGDDGRVALGVEWSRKSDSKPPQAGDRIVGDITESQYGSKIKVDYDATKELKGGGRPSGGGEHSFSRGGAKSPDQQASIQRQVALKILAPTINSDGLTENVKATVEEIEDFINAASGGEATRAEPVPASSPPQATHQELHGLLEKAGLNSNASRVVTDYALTNMSAEEQDAALSMLGNPDRASAAVKRLSEKAEAHYGSPLPSENPDDEIPF